MQELRVMPALDPLDEVEQELEAVANLADNAMMKVLRPGPIHQHTMTMMILVLIKKTNRYEKS